MGMMSAQRQADLLKDKGNLYFKKEKLGAAIDAYTEAITLCPSVPVYWTNRALCERKRNEWHKVESDCRRALELDSHSVKAYYMLGLALLQYQQYEEAVKQLEKALDLGRGATGNYMVEEIWHELAKAKYAEWEAAVAVRQRQQQDLKFHLSQLLREDYEKQLTASIKPDASASQHPSQEQVELTHTNRGSRQPGRGRDCTNEKTNASESIKNFKVSSVVESQRLYRTSSEPVYKKPHESQSNEEKGFDPLKQHKLPLRRGNSPSIRREMSQGVADCLEEQNFSADMAGREQLPTPAELGGEEPASTSAVVRERSSEPAPLALPASKFEFHEGEAPSASLASKFEFHGGEALSDLLPSKFEFQGGEAPSVSVTSRIEPGTATGVPRVDSTTALHPDGQPPTNFHSIHDVFKVFKEFMKLKQHEAGKKLLEVSEVHQRRSKVLDDILETVAARDRPRDIPDHLCCKITMDVFRDPVITPSGVTYERAALLDHLRKVGKFDPFTRTPLTIAQIVPNLALKEAVQVFLDQHGWAYEPC